MHFSLCPGVASGEATLRSPEKTDHRGVLKLLQNRYLEEKSLLLGWLCFKEKKRDKAKREPLLTDAQGRLDISAPCCAKKGILAYGSMPLTPQDPGLPKFQCTFLNTCLQTTPCTLIS